MGARFLGAVAASITVSLAVPASAQEGLSDFTRRVTAELAAQSPEAARAFEQANLARDEGRAQDAARGYERVLELAPEFTHARRRLCGVLADLGRRGDGIVHCRAAVAADPSALNLSALAAILAEGDRPLESHLDEAHELMRRAIDLAPRDPQVWKAKCAIALATEDLEDLRDASRKLVRLAPRDPAAHSFRAIAELADGNQDAARRSVARARALGLPASAADSLESAIDESTPLPLRILPLVAKVGGAWLAGMVLLVAAGLFLSSAALRASKRVPSDPTGRPASGDLGLRAAYRVVLWLSSAYYYVSLPIVIVFVVGAAALILWGVVEMGYIPIKLVFLVGLGALFSVWAILKSVFVRVRDEDPGPTLDVAKNPRMDAALREVADRVRTRPVDRVFLTAGTDVSVFERGGLLRQLRGRTDRCLILGLGVLDGMSTGELKSVLAHEYGHLQNEDTAGGGFAIAVRRSLGALAFGLAEQGVAAWYNPAWLFVIGFYKVFLRISQGASRLQEVLADRWAAVAYGSESFVRGLRHVIARSVAFDAHLNSTLNEVIDKRLALSNLYRYEPAQGVPPDEVEKAVQQALEREPSPYDSHPAPRDRLAWVRALGVPSHSSPADDEPSWSLFADREALERDLTAELRDNIRRHEGIEIAS